MHDQSQELCQIADENDQLIGHKLRSEIDFNKDYYRVGCLWLTNSKNQVLLAQRKLTKDKDPGKWGPAAAGTLEKGETYESNIIKEAEEEIGLINTEFKLIQKIKLINPRKSFLSLFHGICDWPVDKFRPQPEEVEKLEWIDLDKLTKDVVDNPDKYVPSMKLIIDIIANK